MCWVLDRDGEGFEEAKRSTGAGGGDDPGPDVLGGAEQLQARQDQIPIHLVKR
jgi:hypothetical protein